MRKGATLVEVLVVIAVFAILFAIILPAIEGARLEARRTPEIARLRQIGQAAVIYGEGVGITTPTRVLTESGLLPSSLFSSPLDPFAVGVANYERQTERNLGPPMVYRDSVLCVGDLNGLPLIDRLRQGPAFGWSVVFVGSHPSAYTGKPGGLSGWGDLARGIYLRLLDDGAVVRRQPRYMMHDGTKGLESWALFSDFAEPKDVMP